MTLSWNSAQRDLKAHLQDHDSARCWGMCVTHRPGVVLQNRGNRKILLSPKLNMRPVPQQGFWKNGKAFQRLHHRLTEVPACWPWSWSQAVGSARWGWVTYETVHTSPQHHVFPVLEMPLKKYCMGGWCMSIPTVRLAGKRNCAEPCSAELDPRGEPEAKQWGRVCTRAWSTVLAYSSWGRETFWSTVWFFSSRSWDGACPDLFLESGAQLWQGPIAESWEALHYRHNLAYQDLVWTLVGRLEPDISLS